MVLCRTSKMGRPSAGGEGDDPFPQGTVVEVEGRGSGTVVAKKSGWYSVQLSDSAEVSWLGASGWHASMRIAHNCERHCTRYRLSRYRGVSFDSRVVTRRP